MSVKAYDAKIAYDTTQLPIVAGRKKDPDLVTPKFLSKQHGMTVDKGDVLVPIKVWNEYPPGEFPADEKAYWHHLGMRQDIKVPFPSFFPLKWLIHGKEGEILKVKFQGETLRLLCANGQNRFETIHRSVAPAFRYSTSKGTYENPFDFGKYVSTIARRMIPAISMPPALPRIAPDLEGSFAKRRHICQLDSPEQTGETLKLKVFSIIDLKLPAKELTVPRKLVEVCSGWFKTMLEYDRFSKATELDVKCEDVALFEQTMAFLSTNTLDPKNTLRNLLGLIELDSHLNMDPNIAPIYPLCVSLIEKMLSKHDLAAVLHVAFKSRKRELMDICAEFLKKRKHDLALMPKLLLDEIKANLYNPFPAVEFCCKHLRKQLISMKNPDVWFTVFQFLESNKDPHPALKQLKDACVALAITEPKILAKYIEENAFEKLEEIKGLETLKRKLAEAELLKCKIVIRSIAELKGSIV